jgi:Biotin-(acetyl-CoA carboxylase) ligase
MKLKIYSFKGVKSTNDTAIRLIKKNINQGIVTSDIQTNGKGQRGKKWISRKGNLFISIFFPINKKFKFKKNLHFSILKKIKIFLKNFCSI